MIRKRSIQPSESKSNCDRSTPESEFLITEEAKPPGPSEPSCPTSLTFPSSCPQYESEFWAWYTVGIIVTDNVVAPPVASEM